MICRSCRLEFGTCTKRNGVGFFCLAETVDIAKYSFVWETAKCLCEQNNNAPCALDTDFKCVCCTEFNRAKQIRDGHNLLAEHA